MKKRIISAILLVSVIFSMLGLTVFGSCAQGVEEIEYVSAQLPGFEALSNVQLAMTARENILRIRTNTNTHPDTTEKSLEITITSPNSGEYESFSFASVTSIGYDTTNFENCAHDFPRGGKAFGGISIEEAEKISFWVGDYPANGKIKIQLLTAPCAGLTTDSYGYTHYTKGFIFESAEVSPKDSMVMFDIKDFTAVTAWTGGTIYDYLDQVNAVRVILTPGEGNAPNGKKFYIADMRIWKRAFDYDFDIGNGVLKDEGVLKAVSGVENAQLSIRIDEEVFTPDSVTKNNFGQDVAEFKFDTTKYPDGNKIVALYDGDNKVCETTIMVDNKAPYLNYEATDIIYGVETDENGAVIKIPAIISDEGNDITFYQTEFLPTEATENLSNLKDMQGRDPEGETALGEAKDGYFSTTSNTTAVPYQAFEVDVTGKDADITLNYRGSTISGESLIMEVYSPAKSEWVTVAKGDTTGKDNTFSVTVSPADYADANSKIKVRISEYLLGNGSDTFAWTTDTQYYIGYAKHILHYMETQFEWFVEEYNNGNIAYVTNTGDVVETLLVESQYQLAREVHDILDKANIPNGVTPGNHDVSNAYSDQEWIDKAYDMWNKYFGDQYYKHQPWWGGGYLGNTSHYDLITIGGHDIIFLYLGLNHEVTEDGIAWANEVLNKYSHRTAIIATHQFVSRSGGLMAEPYGYAPQIIEHIIEPNPNVRMVICGHEPGAQNLYDEMENGVTVLELLHDYQFTENWGGWEKSGGGRGYFRYMTLGEDTVTSRTYSHSYPDVDHFFDEDSQFTENYTMDIEYVDSEREINTVYFNAVSNVQELGEPTVSENGEILSFNYDGALDGSDAWFYESVDAAGNTFRSKVYPIVELELPESVGTIEITKLPIKLEYVEDEEFDPTGMVVIGYYSDGDSVEITDYQLSGYDSAPGTKTVTVTFEGLTASFEVNVKSKLIKGDLDLDEMVTVSDALVALRIAARLTEATETDFQVGDIDGDGQITVSDALAILRVAARITDSF